VSATVQFLEFCPLRPEILGALLDGTSRPPGSFWFRGLAAAAAAKKAEALCHDGQTGAVLLGSSHCVGLDTQAGNVGETCNVR
jgi:hypothetical protein